MSDMAPSPALNRPPPSARPEPPYDPALERLKLLRGMLFDLAVVGAIITFVLTKAVDGSAGIVILAAMAGAGVVHKGGSVVATGSRLAAGSVVGTMLASLVGRGGST